MDLINLGDRINHPTNHVRIFAGVRRVDVKSNLGGELDGKVLTEPVPPTSTLLTGVKLFPVRIATTNTGSDTGAFEDESHVIDESVCGRSVWEFDVHLESRMTEFL